LFGKELPRHGDERRIEFDRIDAFDGRMLERLCDAAIHSAADEENMPRCGVLQQRVVHRFFGRGLVGRIGQQNSVVVHAANVARLGDGQVAVDRVARSHNMKALPQPRLRGEIHLRCEISEQNKRAQQSCRSPCSKLFAIHPEEQNRRHAQIEHSDKKCNLEGIEKTQEHDAGHDAAEGGANRLQHVSRTGGDTRGERTLLLTHARRTYEERPGERAEQAQAR